MGDVAVRTRALRKTYKHGKTVAVEGLDLSVPAGSVHGFLGPNGAGKTTTIRMLLGLIRADSGTAEIFGHEVPEQLPAVVARIGAIVEQPKFFPHFSGRRNLELIATGIGAQRGAVETSLDAVGLSERAKDKFKTYSLGMKQRLAIAATLLKDPDLVIFDEPTNGLDPAGIHEIRATMRGLADRGKTVLVSSHILAEVQQVADTVTIVGRGRLLAEGPVSEILSGQGASLRVVAGDAERAVAVLQDNGYAVTRSADRSLSVTRDGPLEGDQVARILGMAGVWPSELTPRRADLEQVFLQLTAADHLGAGRAGPGGGQPGGVPASDRPYGQNEAHGLGPSAPESAPEAPARRAAE